MFRYGITPILALFVICSFCGGEFKSLGRHAWRCKEKLKSLGNEEAVVSRNEDSCISMVSFALESSDHVSNCTDVRCCCGKVCNGLRGLKMHQRSCRVIKGLENETFESLESNDIDTGQTACNAIDWDSLPNVKPGIKLPKRDLDWQSANNYFAAAMPISGIVKSKIDDTLNVMNSVIYDYFRDNFGTLEDSNTSHLIEKYKDCSTNSLKSKLKYLKKIHADLDEIKYVAKLLRKKLRDNSNLNNPAIDHDKQIQKNFWGYVKSNFKKNTSSSPSFDASACTHFYHNFFASINPTKSFKIPDWIPSLNQPSISYDLSPPSYQQITNIIRRMKAAGSPCPLDKISIIPFKRCPYLRSYITELFRLIWQSGEIPSVWKKACTVLIHKKGDTTEPCNFRPITLESVPLKIFTSCLRDSLFAFLKANGFIEHKIQKGFLPKLSGTFEHTAQMANVINNARIK